jgi:hypothetical protein
MAPSSVCGVLGPTFIYPTRDQCSAGPLRGMLPGGGAETVPYEHRERCSAVWPRLSRPSGGVKGEAGARLSCTS